MVKDISLKFECELMDRQEKRLRASERERNRKKSKSKKVLLRHKVWLKYNKHCAYCGKILEYKDMQVDHLKPLAYAPYPDDKDSEVHSFKNLMPSCRRCNHYKRANNLEQFRRLMKTLHERIQGLYIGKVAIDYEIVTIKPFNGKFYFENYYFRSVINEQETLCRY